MSKLRLMSLILFSSSALLVGCSTSGEVKQQDQELSNASTASLDKDQQFQTNKAEVIPYESSVQLQPVSVKPSYYNYETSDMSSSERKALLNILSHLQEIDVLIKTAETQQNPDQRIKFRYDWLRKDLYKVNRGISDHLSSPESQPRSFEPVMGEYRR
ncbi:MAG: hypothetical protein HUJ13_03730 [Hydrogenovibrio crunogenus]|nr:hypothetical protein [Hydrogenovibrio crunogenus]